MFDQQHSENKHSAKLTDALFQASGDLRERGDTDRHVFEHSLYSMVVMHPIQSTLAIAGISALLMWLANLNIKNSGGKKTINLFEHNRKPNRLSNIFR